MISWWKSIKKGLMHVVHISIIAQVNSEQNFKSVLANQIALKLLKVGCSSIHL